MSLKRWATHHTANLASGRVMLHNGMMKETELVQHIKRDGHYHDLWQYRLISQEYARLANNENSENNHAAY